MCGMHASSKLCGGRLLSDCCQRRSGRGHLEVRSSLTGECRRNNFHPPHRARSASLLAHESRSVSRSAGAVLKETVVRSWEWMRTVVARLLVLTVLTFSMLSPKDMSSPAFLFWKSQPAKQELVVEAKAPPGGSLLLENIAVPEIKLSRENQLVTFWKQQSLLKKSLISIFSCILFLPVLSRVARMFFLISKSLQKAPLFQRESVRVMMVQVVLVGDEAARVQKRFKELSFRRDELADRMRWAVRNDVTLKDAERAVEEHEGDGMGEAAVLRQAARMLLSSRQGGWVAGKVEVNSFRLSETLDAQEEFFFALLQGAG